MTIFRHVPVIVKVPPVWMEAATGFRSDTTRKQRRITVLRVVIDRRITVLVVPHCNHQWKLAGHHFHHVQPGVPLVGSTSRVRQVPKVVHELHGVGGGRGAPMHDALHPISSLLPAAFVRTALVAVHQIRKGHSAIFRQQSCCKLVLIRPNYILVLFLQIVQSQPYPIPVLVSRLQTLHRESVQRTGMAEFSWFLLIRGGLTKLVGPVGGGSGAVVIAVDVRSGRVNISIHGRVCNDGLCTWDQARIEVYNHAAAVFSERQMEAYRCMLVLVEGYGIRMRQFNEFPSVLSTVEQKATNIVPQYGKAGHVPDRTFVFVATIVHGRRPGLSHSCWKMRGESE